MRKPYFKKKSKFDAPYPKRFLSTDGHWYRSLAERDISFYLQRYEISYETEASIFKCADRKFQYDWKIPYEKDGKKHALYIEYFGYAGKDYYKRRKEKIKLYRKRGLTLISIEPMDLENLDRALRRKLRPYWYYIIGPRYKIQQEMQLDNLMEELPSLTDSQLDKVEEYVKQIKHSRRDYLPVAVETVGKFDKTKGHGAFVSFIQYDEHSNFAFKYLHVRKDCESKDVHVISHRTTFDPARPNLYTAIWELMVRRDCVLAIRKNARHQQDGKYQFWIVDESEFLKTKDKHSTLREISKKRAYDLVKHHALLYIEPQSGENLSC